MYNKSGLKMASKSLANNTSLRYLIFIALYFAQGVPEGITLFAIPAWMAANNKTTEEIAAYTAIGLIPFSFKIF
jgi:PAT family beta-lactamase induction signal transducer AmpG